MDRCRLDGTVVEGCFWSFGAEKRLLLGDSLIDIQGFRSAHLEYLANLSVRD